ncbi:CU044_5270 family protein [Streptomyces griseorubiginosus]|uniref:CU044_5270 family protein n=1 Tax=Streptomyces griseorubiginosus TaxID=67304 RepID=UPI00114091D2|nr:CU044_5270 family protein [Streptomyces griseorubiginosus]
MNEIELLREWDADAPPLTDGARARARFRLQQAMQAPAAPVSVSGVGRRPLLRIAVAGVAAAAVTATVVVTQDTGTEPRTRTVSATTVLRGAAAEALRTEKPVAPRDDQFIYTKEVIERRPVGGGPVKRWVDESWSSVDGSKRSYVSELGHKQWVPPFKKGESTWPPTQWSKLKKLPLDPARLTIVLRDGPLKPDFGRKTRADQWGSIQFYLSGLLRNSVLPKGLRSAAYKALAAVPGVQVLPGRTEFNGHSAIGVRYVGPSGTPWEDGRRVLLFDAKTYQYLGLRERTEIKFTKRVVEQSQYIVASGVVDRVFQRP